MSPDDIEEIAMALLKKLKPSGYSPNPKFIELTKTSGANFEYNPIDTDNHCEQIFGRKFGFVPNKVVLSKIDLQSLDLNGFRLFHVSISDRDHAFVNSRNAMIFGHNEDARLIILFGGELTQNVTNEWIPKFLKARFAESQIPQVEIVAKGDFGLYLKSCDIKKAKTDLDKYYNDDLIGADKQLREFVNNDDQGLAILHGEPGTGKSYYIRHLIATTDKTFVYFPPSMTSLMSAPEFLPFLQDNPNRIFLIEDAEDVLQSRNEQYSNGAVQNILNASSGLLGDIVKVKFVFTFNAPLDRLDSALLRAGRLKYKYEFKKLSLTKSKTLLKEMHDAETNEEMTLADIFNYNWDNNGKIEKKVKLGF
jgi:hypothetical protein